MKNEKVVNLRQAIYETLKYWKRIALLTLIFAILIGVYKTYGVITKVSDNTAIEKEKSHFEVKYNNYCEKRTLLKTEIDNLKKEKKIQNEYNSNSILMKINSFDESIISFSLYIDSKYKIDPNLTYQNIDNTSRLVDAYKSYLKNGELYSEIIELNPDVKDVRFLSEIILTEVSESSSLLNVKIKNVDQASCKKILDIIKEGLRNKTQELQTLIGEHSCELVNETSYQDVDLELGELQQTNQQKITDLANTLSDKTKEYNELLAEGEPVYQFGIRRIIINIIKAILIAAFVGAELGLIYYFMAIIITDKVLSGKELNERMGITIVGEVPKQSKHKLNFIDKWICKIGEVRISYSDYEKICKYIGRNIQGIIDDKDQYDIVLVSASNKDKIEPILSNINKDKYNYNVSFAGNALVDPLAVERVQKADVVVLVEEKGSATYDQVQKEIKCINLWKKEVIGAIIIEADAK